MSGKDYPPPGQHTITDFTAEQDHAEVSQQNVPLGKQTMPQQPMPQTQYVPMLMPQQQYVMGGQGMPQQQYAMGGQGMPQQQYAMGGQGMPQQQYAMGGQAMPPRQQYVQQMPRQQYYQPQQQMPGQPMPQYYQQMPVQQFPVSGGQLMPVVQTPPIVNLQVQPWTTGLCDCANDVENCIITFFCPCITFGQIAELADRGMTSCSGAGLIWILLLYFTGCQWVYSWMYRTKLRAAYSLPEDPCHDCLIHFFCEYCALCQEYRELKNRGFNMNLGWIGNMQLKAQQEAAAAAVVPPPVQGMIR